MMDGMTQQEEADYVEEAAYWDELAYLDEVAYLDDVAYRGEMAYWDEVAYWEEAAYLARLEDQAWTSSAGALQLTARAPIVNPHDAPSTAAQPHISVVSSDSAYDTDGTPPESLAGARTEACDDTRSLGNEDSLALRSVHDIDHLRYRYAPDEADLGPLPPGTMEAGTRRQIQSAMRRTPRYLFRCWTNDPVCPSGGYVGLNTTAAITPLAFSKVGRGGSPSIYDLDPVVLGGIALSHLCGGAVSTQFSSWAASLQTALYFRGGEWQHCFVSIIDTTQLPDNVIMHVPSMAFLLGTTGWDHEYLAHGVIQSPGHRAVPLLAFVEFAFWYRDSRLPFVWPYKPAPAGGYPQITREEVADARRIGERYGGDLVVPVTVALLCRRRRDAAFWRSGTIPALDIIADGLADCEISPELCSDASIQTSIVYTTDFFGDVEQMIQLLRALVELRYPDGLYFGCA